ncbi:hypothetical protein WN51_01884 [Melipona quadrifasciata]|uniref:Uncharacterized protein n=1 Tax=Melipona quadrifasciata TaxID=166423 RepID=A0A0M8ZXE1_9HYME|nr:hypothetical protein WN51_01884 [Melipona quadrifasciata]
MIILELVDSKIESKNYFSMTTHNLLHNRETSSSNAATQRRDNLFKLRGERLVQDIVREDVKYRIFKSIDHDLLPPN